jgi:hypothetical protein
LNKKTLTVLSVTIAVIWFSGYEISNNQTTSSELDKKGLTLKPSEKIITLPGHDDRLILCGPILDSGA